MGMVKKMELSWLEIMCRNLVALCVCVCVTTQRSQVRERDKGMKATRAGCQPGSFFLSCQLCRDWTFLLNFNLGSDFLHIAHKSLHITRVEATSLRASEILKSKSKKTEDRLLAALGFGGVVGKNG